MNFSLINKCGTLKNDVCGHSFFWSGTIVSLPIIIIVINNQVQVQGKNCNFIINRDHSNKKVEKQGQSST